MRDNNDDDDDDSFRYTPYMKMSERKTVIVKEREIVLGFI